MRKQEKQDKIRVSNGEDLLAFIPQIVGYWPENSLVCIGMSGKALRATMRLDLPSGDAVNLRRFADIVARQLASDELADSTLIAIFANDDWTNPAYFPHENLYKYLQAAFASVGMPVRESWYVGKENWRSIECTVASCCPWPGQSNAKISESFVTAEFVYRGRSLEGNPRDRIPAMTGVSDSGFAERVADADAGFLDHLAEHGLAKNQLSVTLGAWERTLVHWPQKPDPSMVAYLLASLSCPPVRDAVMVSLATSPELSLTGVVGLEQAGLDIPHLMSPEKWSSDNQALGYTIGVLDESENVSSDARSDYGDILLGGSVEEDRESCQPNWLRLDQGEQLLLFLAQSVRGPGKAPVLCMLGWVQWCRGRGSWAGYYFQAAQSFIPGYSLAVLLEQLLSAGYIAPWAKNPRSAWPGYINQDEAR